MNTTKNKKLRNSMILFGIIVAIATIAYFWVSSTENSKKEAHIANAMKILSAAEIKEANGWDFPPEGLDVYEALEVGNRGFDLSERSERERDVVQRFFTNTEPANRRIRDFVLNDPLETVERD